MSTRHAGGDIGRLARAILNVEQTVHDFHWTDLAITLEAIDPTE